MKKMCWAAMATIGIMGAAHADFQAKPRGGFAGGMDNVITVRQAREMRDDTYVVLQGNIVQRISNDKYLFEDQTGSITVEIEKKDWAGVTVTPNDTVRLFGEVDSGLFKTEIDVDHVELVGGTASAPAAPKN